MTKRAVLVSAVVVIALIVAAVGATAAVHLIGSGTLGPGGRALSEADVRTSFARGSGAPTTSPSQAPTADSGREQASPPHRSGSPGTAPAAKTGVFPGSAGTVFASCSSGQITLTRWIPQNGYSTDGIARGPAASAWVKFKSDSHEVTVTATCVNGQPHFVTMSDDRGGGDGRGGGSSSSGGSGH